MKKKTALIIVSVLLCALVLFACFSIVFVFAFKSVFLYEWYSNDASAWDHFITMYPIPFPFSDHVGQKEEIFIQCISKRVFVALLITQTGEMIVRYDEKEFERWKERIEEENIFEDEPVYDVYRNVQEKLRFSLDGFDFRLLSPKTLIEKGRINKLKDGLGYPNSMFFIGINERDKTIAYVWFIDSDIDRVDVPLDVFLVDECGWTYPEEIRD